MPIYHLADFYCLLVALGKPQAVISEETAREIEAKIKDSKEFSKSDQSKIFTN